MKTHDLTSREAAAIRQLTQAQINRRKFMLGVLASGAAVTAAGVLRFDAFAQATPEAAATPVAAPYDGPLAAEQSMTLPLGKVTTMDPGISYGDSELSIFY